MMIRITSFILSFQTFTLFRECFYMYFSQLVIYVANKQEVICINKNIALLCWFCRDCLLYSCSWHYSYSYGRLRFLNKMVCGYQLLWIIQWCNTTSILSMTSFLVKPIILYVIGCQRQGKKTWLSMIAVTIELFH